MKYHFSCQQGLEQVLKREIQLAGYQVTNNQATLVSFQGDESAIAKLNIRSRVGNKLYLEIDAKQVTDFDGLFDLVNQIDWNHYIQADFPITVTANTNRSKLTSVPSIQGICKKAIVKKLLNNQDGMRNEDKNNQAVEILINLDQDKCSVLLNTTGDALYKRGYRISTGDAPLNESLAAGLVLLSGWKFSTPFYDIFCGSGTILIEAAMIAKNIAPGLLRKFAFEQFAWYDQSIYTREIADAKSKIMTEKEHKIMGSDIDPDMIQIAKENAINAGVDKYITWEVMDAQTFGLAKLESGTLLSDPPYGLRLKTQGLGQTYQTICDIFGKNPKLNGGIITSYDNFENMIDPVNRKKTSIFNGGEKCYFYKRNIF